MAPKLGFWKGLAQLFFFYMCIELTVFYYTKHGINYWLGY